MKMAVYEEVPANGKFRIIVAVDAEVVNGKIVSVMLSERDHSYKVVTYPDLPDDWGVIATPVKQSEPCDVLS